jgi:hypothetical protein
MKNYTSSNQRSNGEKKKAKKYIFISTGSHTKDVYFYTDDTIVASGYGARLKAGHRLSARQTQDLTYLLVQVAN